LNKLKKLLSCEKFYGIIIGYTLDFNSTIPSSFFQPHFNSLGGAVEQSFSTNLESKPRRLEQFTERVARLLAFGANTRD
jgi:hypothetical protein